MSTIQVNSIVDIPGTGAPDFPNGITSTGNVGIGTSSPASALDVVGSGNFNAPTYCPVIVNSGTVIGQIAANAGGSVDVRAVSNHPLTFFTNNSERMRINSLGYIDMPAQPVIAGQIGTALINPIAGPGLLAFNEFWVSRGIAYNSTTRRFTVPVAGIYRITLNPFKLDTATYRVLVGINTDTPTNASNYGSAFGNATGYETGCINSVVTLQANDYIVFYLQLGNLYNIAADKFNQFSIQKIA